MLGIILASLLGAAPAEPGPVFIKTEVVTARSCPKDSCASAGEVRAGEQFRLMAIEEGWARVMAPNGISAWVPLDALGAGEPGAAELKEAASLRACPKKSCDEVRKLEAGEAVTVLDETGDGVFLMAGEDLGFVLDGELLSPREVASAAPKYIPPAEPPKYIAPTEAPQYIPPAAPPKYIPAAAPAIYIPPAQPAGLESARQAQESIVYVRRSEAAIREEPRAEAGVATSLPGGARLHVKNQQGEWLQVSQSESSAVPALGWVSKVDVRDFPPLIYRVKSEGLSVKDCLKPDCEGWSVDGMKEGDAVVAIDESKDGTLVLLLLPGQERGTHGWAMLSSLEAAK